MISALAAYRKFAALFVDQGAMQKLLAVPRVLHTFFGLSSCLFTIGSLQVRQLNSWIAFLVLAYCFSFGTFLPRFF